MSRCLWYNNYMDILEAIDKRHSVRSYTDRRIEGEVKNKLEKFLAVISGESGLNMQLVTDEPNAFGGFMAHYGKFKGVKNYITVVGKKAPSLQETAGYYGEKAVLYAQTLGLNTCWVALTYSKGKTPCEIKDGEKLCVVIAVGYGETQGRPHKSKPVEKVAVINADSPEWFKKGVEAALLAPTAMNQQKFLFAEKDGVVSAKAKRGFYSKMDLGIVKYHFETGAGKENFEWA